MLKTFSLRNGVYQKVRLLLMRTFRQIISVICIIAITLALSIAPATASENLAQGKNKIIVGGEIGYPPYSFLNEKGEPTGLSVELTRAIAKIMGINIEIRLTPWTEARNALENSTIDIIPGMFYSEERARIFDFSPPYSIVSTAIFARIHSPSVESIEDTRDKEIIVMRGEAMHDYILKHRLTDRILLTETPADALRLLASGKGDYALVAQMPGFYWIKELKLSNITSVGPSLEPFENCFAVRKGNNLLLSSFTEGLSIINQTGEYQQISEKWLGVLMPTRINTGLMIKYAAIVLIPLILLLALSFLWSWMLRSRVNIKTKELLESEERFSLAIDGTRAGLWDWDMVKDQVVFSTRWKRMLGYEPHEVEDAFSGWKKLWHPDDCESIEKSLQDHLAGKTERYEIIHRLRHKDGDWRWILTRGDIIRDAQGNPLRWVGTNIDITERKQAEEELRRNEKDLRESQRIAHVGSWEYNLNTGQFWGSDEAKRIYGFDPNQDTFSTEAIESCIFERDRVHQALIDLIEKGTKYNLEFQIFPVNSKQPKILTSIAELQKNDKGLPMKVHGVIQDITERKQAIENLRKSEAKHSKMVANIGDVIVVIDQEGINKYKSPNIEKIFGWKPEEVVGASTWDNVHPDDIEFTQQFFEKMMNEPDAVRTMECRYRCKNGSYKWIEFTGTNLFHDPDIQGLLGNYQDITERKQAEAEREKLHAQLNQAQKMESVGRLAGGVAHDFNNMLGVILGHTELALLKAKEDNDLISDLKEIQNAAKRSAAITKQLLAFARKEIISPRKLDLRDTVESMLNMLRRLIGEDIDLVWKPSAHLWPVKMDPTQIDQILANLCVNARDAISGVGKLTIETGRKTFDKEYCSEHPGFIPGDFVLLAVSDNGCGMDKDTLDNLFEPFFTTKEVGKGTGLGLATIYGIVKQNNGFINVYSEPGQGSTFKIYLPRLVADEDIDKAVPEKKAAAGGTETILLVEDEPTILRMTLMMLEKKGYNVLFAATPVEAVEKATHHLGPIDMLMTDVVMPEMNGRDLAAQITALYPGIRLLFMSGYTANVIAHHGVLDDGVAFIQKPFSMAEMTEKVRVVLDTASDKN
jgi:PAS domain S-box-containing protein